MELKIILIIIGSLVLLGLVIFGLIFAKYLRSEAIESANSFLSQLQNSVYNKAIEVIKNFDYDNQSNLNTIESDILNKMYESTDTYIKSEILRCKSNLKSSTIKVMDNKFIKKFIDNTINNIDIIKSVEEQLGDRFDKLQAEFVKEDETLKREYSNESIYYINDKNIKLEESNNIDLPESDLDGLETHGFIKASKEEIKKLNPQSDEEELYNQEDESMEIILEDSNNSDYTVDSLGRLHDKVTGKFIKKNNNNRKGENK